MVRPLDQLVLFGLLHILRRADREVRQARRTREVAIRCRSGVPASTCTGSSSEPIDTSIVSPSKSRNVSGVPQSRQKPRSATSELLKVASVAARQLELGDLHADQRREERAERLLAHAAMADARLVERPRQRIAHRAALAAAGHARRCAHRFSSQVVPSGPSFTTTPIASISARMRSASPKSLRWRAATARRDQLGDPPLVDRRPRRAARRTIPLRRPAAARAASAPRGTCARSSPS